MKEKFVNLIFEHSVSTTVVVLCLVTALVTIGVILIIRHRNNNQNESSKSYSIYRNDARIDFHKKESNEVGRVNHKIFPESVFATIKDGSNIIKESSFSFRGVNCDFE